MFFVLWKSVPIYLVTRSVVFLTYAVLFVSSRKELHYELTLKRANPCSTNSQVILNTFWHFTSSLFCFHVLVYFWIFCIYVWMRKQSTHSVLSGNILSTKPFIFCPCSKNMSLSLSSSISLVYLFNIYWRKGLLKIAFTLPWLRYFVQRKIYQIPSPIPTYPFPNQPDYQEMGRPCTLDNPTAVSLQWFIVHCS